MSDRAEKRLFCRAAYYVAVVVWLSACQRAAAADARLPNGTNFVFWEQPLTFSKTYYVDNNSDRADDNGPGSSEQPFRTISKAAGLLQPGERVVIATGIYRECVHPARGGTGPDRMISYEAAPGATVVVKGSEILNDGWRPSTAVSRRGGGAGPTNIWQHDLTGAMFPDAYNPFAMDDAQGDRGWLDTKAVDMGPYFRRRGMIFVDGKPLEPVELSRDLADARPPSTNTPPAGQTRAGNGMPSRTRPGPIMQEIGGSSDGRFWVEPRGTTIHMRLPAGTPAHPQIELTTREQAFVPLQSGLGYIRIKGITFEHGASNFPPPQRGLVSTKGGHHWIIEGNTIEWDNAVGLDIGNGDWNGPRSMQPVGFHVIRGNTIRYCGIEGVAGMGTQNTLIEDNLIEWVGWQGAERAWESAGAKFHRAQNMLFRHNIVRHIRNANALWLDSGNTNCRITGNVFADVLTVSAAVHMEMNRNYNQIDNNVIWNVRNAEPGTPGQRGAAGSGIFEHATDRLIIVQNLIGRCDNAGVYPVLRPERAGAGTAQGNEIFNNIFAGCSNAAIVFINRTNEADGNVYVSLSSHYLGFFTTNSQQWLDLPAWRESHGWDKNGAQVSMRLDFDPDRLLLTITSQEPLPKVSVFDQMDNDMFGNAAGNPRVPGPFADLGAKRVLQVDPRSKPRQKTTPATN